MTDRYDGVERRDRQQQQDRHAGIERYIGVVLQGIVLALILWIGTSVLDLNKTAIRLEERYTAAAAAGTRVESDVSAIRNQLQTMNTSIQASTFKVEDLDRRVKGLELMKERIR
jgi:hypothetical protein